MRTVKLHNFYDNMKLPALSEVVSNYDGINISYEHLTEEVVKACHQHDKLVCVWVDAEVTKETVAMYKRLIDLGVDSFCSDFPLEVTNLRDQIMQGEKMSNLAVPKADDVSSLTKASSNKEDTTRPRGFSIGMFDEADQIQSDQTMEQLHIL